MVILLSCSSLETEDTIGYQVKSVIVKPQLSSLNVDNHVNKSSA